MKIGPEKAILEQAKAGKVVTKRHTNIRVPASYTLPLLSVPVPLHSIHEAVSPCSIRPGSLRISGLVHLSKAQNGQDRDIAHPLTENHMKGTSFLEGCSLHPYNECSFRIKLERVGLPQFLIHFESLWLYSVLSDNHKNPIISVFFMKEA